MLVSNILGTVNPVEAIVRRAQEVGALVCIDASQAAPHMPLDVQALQADFVAFTGHKMCGPTGIGVLWGRQELLEDLPPFLGGGEMIETVSMSSSTYAPAPHKFEAGTPPIAQAVGLGAAIDYLSGIGMDKILAHEHAITEYAVKRLLEVPDLRIIGPATAEDRGAAISFTLGDIHPHDVGQVLDEQGIAVRVGHHCARPVCLRYGIPATTRASFYLYSTPRTSTHWSTVWSTYGTSSDEGLRREAGLHVPGRHPGPLQEPARPGSSGWRRRGAPRQPDVRRRDHAAREVRRHDHQRRQLRGQGCSISQASASVLNDLLVGKDLAEAQKIQGTFLELMQSKGKIEPDDAMEEVLEDAIAFAGVSKYPARVKCALLSWMAWKDATAQALGADAERTTA